jgi:hypothetical protein
MNAIEYIQRLEQIISDLHYELEMTAYSVEDCDAASNIVRTADRLWNEFCATKSQHYETSTQN